MNAKEIVRLALTQSQGLLMGLIKDLKDDCLTMPTSNGGNHPLWVVGHLAYAEAGLVEGFICGRENPLAKWKSVFGGGSVPVADASKYPSWDEVVGEWVRAREATFKVLESLSEADFDRASHAPENRKAVFGTVGQVLNMITIHSSMHAGQITDARRAAGKKPVIG